MSEDFGTTLLPLEEYLKTSFESNRDEFPDRNVDYIKQYINIKDNLINSHFRDANAGLAVDGNRYTHHDLGHVNDVIEMAGCMLRNDDYPITGYEAYMLLIAILLHDSGNSEGRKGHEQKTLRILIDMNDIAGIDSVEKKLIAKIARAHGGIFNIGTQKTKDTIGELIIEKESVFSSGQIKVRSRALAGILRLADELSEKKSRANKAAVNDGYNIELKSLKPDVVHNIFCDIIRIDVLTEYHEIQLKFDIDKSLLQRTFSIEESDENNDLVVKNIYLVDYIIKRLIKCNLERLYCNRYMYGILRFDMISVSIDIHEDLEDLEDPGKWNFKIEDKGYPQADDEASIRELAPSLDGLSLYNTYKN